MTGTNRLCCNREPVDRCGARPTRVHAAVTLALVLGGGATSAGAAVTQVAAGPEWTTAGGTPQGTRYSSLQDITPDNVKSLKEEFSFQTGVAGKHMGEPLVIGSTLYAVTPYPNRLIAYDLTTGKTKWTFAPKIDEYARGVHCCSGINRGAAYADGKIVFNLLDNTVVAVDAKTGKQVWRNHLEDPRTGITMSGAPIIAKGNVIVGTVSGEMGVRGFVQALDLKTGQKKWRAYTTGPDADVKIGKEFHAFYPKDQGKDVGATSWPNQRASLLGGSSVWAYLTYDPDLNLVFYGTSQPGVWNADMRPGDNKWGASIFARRPDTGEAVWAYQVTPHDSWDYDAISESIPVDLTIDGTPRKLLVHLNKNGFAYTFDRATGEILLAPQFAPEVNWATHVDLDTGIPAIIDSMRVHEGKVTENICPSALGGKGWEPGAFSPKTGIFYMPTFNLCMNLEALRAEYIASAPYMGMDMKMGPGSDPSYASELIAWDATKGKKLWGVKEAKQIYAGVLSTAGGVVFYTTKDPKLKAVSADPNPDDVTTGGKNILFEAQLECNAVGNPISFAGPDGKQRIAVFSDDDGCNGSSSGGDGEHKRSSRGGDEHQRPTSGGGKVHVYKLP